MSAFTLFGRKDKLGGLYAGLIMNRLQMLYYFLIMPMYLAHFYMVWVILGLGLLSQLMLWMLSKWLVSPWAARGLEGFKALLGPKTIRLLAAVGLIPLVLKTSVIVLGYSGIVHEYIFPVMNKNVPLIVILLLSCYMASHGMEKTVRFVMIAFLGSVWVIICYLPFYFPPVADFKQLYPLIPIDPPLSAWKGVVICWSALSGPEYLAFLAPWLKPDRKTFKHLAIANLFTIFEYLLLFVATVLYYGSDYLKTAGYPVLNMISYLQSPIFERIEILLISFFMFNVVFAVSLLLLFFYGALRIMAGKTLDISSRFGYVVSCILMGTFLVIANEKLWRADTIQNLWPGFFMYSEAATFLLVPILLLIAIRRKGQTNI
jgi:hypothetical protein